MTELCTAFVSALDLLGRGAVLAAGAYILFRIGFLAYFTARGRFKK